ncbi:MAG: bifunctional 5,10-methylene-tetrahydrofolate dehydrogenase/5,10-methylene-tetrahydrofolate cyclohydrolase [Paludibacteraceae bacterium]|nr:bifunctional 5,10-methylene-tetrahydrofolate dehydrogenase/5,10-methylene-tetrahydrofolate cyclohydrolase [Paludibacteraceae bacterium]
MTILNGKQIAAEIRSELKAQIDALRREGLRAPRLGIVIVGHNPASETYVANKIKACAEVGIEAVKIAYEDTISEQDLLAEVHKLNSDTSMDGFIVQLPLPKHIDEQTVTSAIDYRKDVDGLTPENVGRAAKGLPCIVSATPRGIRELLSRYNITTDGKHIVVIGRSNIVGKPMATLLMQKHERGNATVTLCHSHTVHLKEICLSADIIIVAVGHPGLLTADMVREGTTVIDVGITRVEDATTEKGYRLCGDVDFDNVAPKCAYITPVPGGVGPMTIVSLLQNTLQAYSLNAKL